MSILVEILIEVVISVASILIVLWFESKRKPKLRFSISEVAEIKPNDPRGLQPAKLPHVYVYNESMPRWLSWAFDRNPALACRGEISFHNRNGQDLFGRPMPVRWANNPEPFARDPKTGQFTGIDWDKMRIGPLWDIPPGNDPGILNIVYRAKTDPECYGYNNDSYLHNWRNPEWKLNPGQYLAKIVIRTGGQTFTETVQIMNVDTTSFGLSHLLPGSKSIRSVKAKRATSDNARWPSITPQQTAFRLAGHFSGAGHVIRHAILICSE